MIDHEVGVVYFIFHYFNKCHFTMNKCVQKELGVSDL